MTGNCRLADESHDLSADKSAAESLVRFEVVYRCALAAFKEALFELGP